MLHILHYVSLLFKGNLLSKVYLKNNLVQRVIFGSMYIVAMVGLSLHFPDLLRTILTVWLSIEAFLAIAYRSNNIQRKLGFIFAVLLIHYFMFRLFYMPERVYEIILLASLVDTFAYITGRIVGGPKLAKKISPKKTISGAIGGVLFTVIFWLMYTQHTLHAFVPPSFMMLEVSNFTTIIGLISIAISAQIGDLFISYIKRVLKIKDSGSLIIGHGGIWDRLDSVFGIVILSNIFTDLLLYVQALF